MKFRALELRIVVMVVVGLHLHCVTKGMATFLCIDVKFYEGPIRDCLQSENLEKDLSVEI